MSTTTDRILASAADGIGWLTFNNPERRNAMSLDMWAATAEALHRFEADPGIRVVVMKGAGGKAFVSGADISQFGDQRDTPEKAEAYRKITEDARVAMNGFGKPLIAMIEGFCIGGGVRVALSADIRVAADDSTFGIPAAKLGLAYDFESVTKLIEVVGAAATRDLLFTGRRLDAQEALRMGLVHRLVPAGSLQSAVEELAREIAQNAPLTIRAAKFAINQAVVDAERRDMAGVDARARACFASEDYANGRTAFMEKRRPVFVGR